MVLNCLNLASLSETLDLMYVQIVLVRSGLLLGNTWQIG